MIGAKSKEELFDMLKMFYGLPPHDGFNICLHDGYFYRSIEVEARKAGYDMKELEKEFSIVKHKWKLHRDAFLAE